MFISNLSVSQKGLLLVSMPFLFGIVFTAIMFGLIHQSEKDLASEIKAKETLGIVNRLTVHMIDAATARAALRIKKTETDAGGPQYWLNESRDDIRNLKQMEKNDKTQIENIAKLEKLLDSASRDVEKVMSSDDTPTTLSDVVDVGQIGMIDSYITSLTNLTEKLIAPATSIDRQGPVIRARDRERIHVLLWSAIVLNIVLTIAMTVLFGKNITDRLNIVQENAGLIAKKQPLKQQLDGIDEIAILDSAFHKAADELEQAERMKQVVISILNHEVRSPLTSVQATFYLAGQGALGTLDDEAQHAVEQCEKESGELIVIVNNLLELWTVPPQTAADQTSSL